MIFGRKRAVVDPDPVDTEEEAIEIVGDDTDVTPAEAEAELEEAFDDDAGASGPEAEEVDWRADGPFDSEEVDLGGDGVTRIDLGPLVITPWPGIGLQLQVNEADRKVQAVTAVWKNSGLEVALFAAPASGGLAAELREDAVDEAEQAGGNATIGEGPFGAEVRRVLPQEGPGGEQLFHVSRIWFAEGPRWLLRGTLLGEAAIGEADTPVVTAFAEFFRNLVVRRGSQPLVPGVLIPLQLPDAPTES